MNNETGISVQHLLPPTKVTLDLPLSETILCESISIV